MTATPASPPVSSPSADRASPTFVLLLSCGAAFLVIFDLTVVNFAFPDLHRDFSSTPLPKLSWALAGYGVLFAALLAPAGRVAAVASHSLFMWSVAVFTVASAVGAAAPNEWFLIAARALQGAAAAGVISSALGLVLTRIPARNLMGALGVWSAVGSSAVAAAPAVGGVLVELGSWRAFFAVNVPIGLVLLYGALRRLDRDGAAGYAMPDLVGAALLAAGAGIFVIGLSQGSLWGWGSVWVLSCLLVGLLLAATALVRSAGHPAPAFELDLLRNRTFAVANAASLSFSAAMFSWMLAGPLFLIRVWEYSVLQAGLAFTPAAFAAAVAAIVVGRRVATPTGLRVVLVGASLLFTAVCIVMWAVLGSEKRLFEVFLLVALLGGVGAGATLTALFGTAASAVPPLRFASGSGTLMASRQFGGAVGVAGMVAVVTAPSHTGSADQYLAVFLFSGVASVVVAVAGAGLLPSLSASAQAPTSAEAVPVPVPAPASAEAVAPTSAEAAPAPAEAEAVAPASAEAAPAPAKAEAPAPAASASAPPPAVAGRQPARAEPARAEPARAEPDAAIAAKVGATRVRMPHRHRSLAVHRRREAVSVVGGPRRSGGGTDDVERRGWKVGAAVSAALLIGVGVFMVAGSLAGSGSGCSDGVVLRVGVAPEIEPVVAGAARRMLEEGRVVGGKCVRAEVAVVESAQAVTLLGQGVALGSLSLPDVWIPDSSLWTLLVQSLAPEREVMEVTGTSVAQSPVVVGIPRGLAELLRSRGIRVDLSWVDVFGAAGGLASAATAGESVVPPGLVEVRLPDPAANAAGLAALVAVNRAWAADPSGLAKLTGVIQAVRGSVVADAQAGFADFGGDGGRYPAVVVPEQAVFAYNRSSPAEPALAVYPRDGTLAMDYPYTITAVDPEKAAAARVFEDVLRDAQTGAQARALGFRSADGAVPAEFGMHGAVNPELIPAPAPAQVRDVAQAWYELSLRIRNLMLISVAEPMGEQVVPQLTRLRATVQGLQGVVGLLPADTEMGLWSVAAGEPDVPGWREVVDVAPLDSEMAGREGHHQQHLIAALAELHVEPGAGSGLYDAVLAAVRAARDEYQAGAMNSVLVITGDSGGDPGGMSSADLIAALGAEFDPARPVQVVIIGYAGGADLPVLRQVAEATGGTAFTVDSPQQIRDVILVAMSRRVCTEITPHPVC